MSNFKELKIWQQSKDLAVIIYKLTDTISQFKDFGLKDQMRRASVSVPSNIAEGDHLDTDKQDIRHFFIARGSIAELRTQLAIAEEVGYISLEQYDKTDKEDEKISAMLMALIKHRAKLRLMANGERQ